MIIVRVAAGLAIILVGTYIVLAIFLYAYQSKFVFVPTRNMVMSPGEAGLTFEDVNLQVSSGETIRGWYLPVDDSAPTVLFCYGNGGNKSRRVMTMQFLVESGVNMAIFDYRGYGASDGKPSEDNCYEDVRTVYDWLREEKHVPPERIIIFGRSLGGGVAVDLASKVDCAALIVESSFTSALDMGRRMFPYMFADKIMRFEFDSISKISKVGCPVMITHSVEDELIPFEMGRSLYDRALAPKQFIKFTGAHNDRDFLSDDNYRQPMQAFLRLQ